MSWIQYVLYIILSLVCMTNDRLTNNRESTEGYSRWKVEKRHGKFWRTETCSKWRAKAIVLKSNILNGLNNRTLAIDCEQRLKVVRQWSRNRYRALHVTSRWRTRLKVSECKYDCRVIWGCVIEIKVGLDFIRYNPLFLLVTWARCGFNTDNRWHLWSKFGLTWKIYMLRYT